METALENENILNVTLIEPALKHPTIFEKFDELISGESLILHNDHDPKPLYYELSAERGDIFSWEYLEQGPETWKVKITKNKKALFTDIGNIWNFKNTRPDGMPDTTQFKFKNLYQQLGVSSGVGFRFDFNYFLIRFDVAFRFKRPDVLADDGWQIPDISFKNLFSSDYDNRLWRYENFNATIGIGYAF